MNAVAEAPETQVISGTLQENRDVRKGVVALLVSEAFPTHFSSRAECVSVTAQDEQILKGKTTREELIDLGLAERTNWGDVVLWNPGEVNAWADAQQRLEKNRNGAAIG